MRISRIGLSILLITAVVLLAGSDAWAQFAGSDEALLNQLWREFRFGTGQAIALTGQGATQQGVINVSGTGQTGTGTGTTGTATSNKDFGNGAPTKATGGSNSSWLGPTKCIDPWKRSSTSTNTTGTTLTGTTGNTGNTGAGTTGVGTVGQFTMVQPNVVMQTVEQLTPDLIPMTVVVRTRVGAAPPAAAAAGTAGAAVQKQTGSGVITYVPGPEVASAAGSADSGYSKFMDTYQGSDKPVVTRVKVSSEAADQPAAPAKKAAKSSSDKKSSSGSAASSRASKAGQGGDGTVQPNVQPSNVRVVSGSTPGVIDGRSSRGRR